MPSKLLEANEVSFGVIHPEATETPSVGGPSHTAKAYQGVAAPSCRCSSPRPLAAAHQLPFADRSQAAAEVGRV